MKQMAQRLWVPKGYRFNPTPEELIRYYLNPWVTGKQITDLSSGAVCVDDIYALGPEALTSRFHHYGHDGNWYFLCVVRWKGSKARTRMNRCVQGGGAWHCSSKRKAVGREGYRQGFEYRDAGKKKTVWIMEEFMTNLKEATDGEGVKVICKVYHSPSPYKKLLMMTDAGVNRARLDGEHGLAACSVPSPTEYYAGTSQGAPKSASGTWQQSMMEQGMGIDGEPEPLVPVESAGMEGLPVPPKDYGYFDVPDLGWPMDEWCTSGDFRYGATDGVEGGHDPTAAT